MKLGYAEQYNKSCIIIEPEDECEDIIEMAEMEDAMFWEGPGEKAYVVQFPGRPKELYSEQALQRSLSPDRNWWSA